MTFNMVLKIDQLPLLPRLAILSLQYKVFFMGNILQFKKYSITYLISSVVSTNNIYHLKRLLPVILLKTNTLFSHAPKNFAPFLVMKPHFKMISYENENMSF